MTTPAQETNLSELLVALQSTKVKLSDELQTLLSDGLHHSHLPPALHTSAAEAFQLAFEAWGGIPRLLLFADRYPGAFLKLYARQTQQTIAPVLPAPPDRAHDEWPPWLTARRLAYQEQRGGVAEEGGGDADQQEDVA
jgi:hypothetical protein